MSRDLFDVLATDIFKLVIGQQDFQKGAVVALLLLAGPLTVAIFHYGKFDEQDVRMSTLALMAYSSGLMAFSMVKVLAPESDVHAIVAAEDGAFWDHMGVSFKHIARAAWQNARAGGVVAGGVISAHYGWRQEDVSKNAQVIADLRRGML